MGAGQSAPSKAPSRALHVLRVTPSSPASQTTIEPYFDFIVGFKDENLTSDGIDAPELEKIVEDHEGRALDLLVWNSKSEATRVVPIIPSREWSLPHTHPDPKEPDEDRKPSLLGLSMRMCEPELTVENVWHVLDVLEGSPAESAGLVPYGDWIIGWSGGVLSAESDFYDVVESHIDKPLRVYVYSYDFDNIREVVLVPNRHWGGEGLLGCVFGFGLLHRVPPIPESREPGALPAELVEQEEFEEQELFVPADITDGIETPEQAEERLQWETREREIYARNYAAAVNQTSPSAYDPSSDSVRLASHHGTDPEQYAVNLTEASSAGILVHTPTARDGRQQPGPMLHVNQSSRPSTPVHASFASPRAPTPTQNRPLGYHVNGLGIRPRTPSWDVRMFDMGQRAVTSPSPDTADDEDRETAVSVAETDTTDTTVTSEGTSQGSLTSVD
ncbi:GRASP55/65 PDZ-like domain-containing protein [Irpex rosettiformis]|uniref:GRASP55/65 PDZ-like domain-containing protein n=1 Tax=Irpex rosettiformis TaxID=378272 RepID=A0ACB8TRW6_9APHY|nr:GRASP55/65 PDZ-like domain-containing protein [Irpex rosettiformis]